MPTLRDVAREAGVNVSTASRALTGAYGVHDETRRKVLSTAERLAYRPNRVARGLATGRSHSLALLISDIRNPFFAEFARGAEDAAYEAGCDLILCNSDLNPAKQMGYFRSLREKQIDGIIMNTVAALGGEERDELVNSRVPVVLLNKPKGDPPFSTVLADNLRGGFLAGKHLIDLGHTAIAHLTGPRTHGNFNDRTKGLLEAVRCAKRKIPAPIVMHGYQGEQGGYELTQRLLADRRGVTAIFAGNDAMALGAIRAIAEAGLRIPDDISLVGFDDVPVAAIVHPALTTIRVPKYEMGRAAVEILLAASRAAGQSVPEHRTFGVTFIQRASCAARISKDSLMRTNRLSLLPSSLLLLSGILFGDPARAAEYPWMETARVFLIDAYEPPFAPKLEFDAKALADTMVQMNANTVRIATMGKYALVPGVRFTRHPELGDRDILAETIAACKQRGIRVVPYVSTGHKLAWSMVTRDYPEYAQQTKPGGGPERSHMFAGEDHGTVCWNTSYRQAYLDLVERLVRDYDIDGIYFDTWRPGYFWTGRQVCYCDGCRNGFRKAKGAELPWHEKDADYTPADLQVLDRYHAWQRENLIDLVHTVRRLVKSHKDIPLIYNINNPKKLTTEDPRIVEAMDAFLYERGNSLLERAEGVSLARAAGLGVWPYVGVYNNWPRVIYNGFDYQQQIFSTAMFGGAPIIAQPWAYLQHAENRRFVEYPFRVLKQHEAEFTGFRNYPYVAVVYADRNPRGHAQSGWWWKTDARTSSLGAFAACLYGHVQVSSIHEGLLDKPEKLSAYRVLYLAGVADLSETRVKNIREFVRNGGGLVVSHASSLFDGSGKRQTRFALEDLVRVAPLVPTGELAATIDSYRSVTGGPYDLYLAPKSKPSLEKLVPLWFFEPVKVLDGGETWMDIVTGDGLRPILPGVILSSYGKGRVAYCASALESLFLEMNDSALGAMVRSLVAKVAPEQPPFEVEAPSALMTNLTVRDSTLVLHMTNWTGNKFERDGANEYHLSPVENVRIRLAVPAGKRVRSVALLVEAPYTKKQTGSTLELLIPRVEAYQGVRVDLE